MENEKNKVVQMFDRKTDQMYYFKVMNDEYVEPQANVSPPEKSQGTEQKEKSGSADNSTLDRWTNASTLAFIAEYEAFQKAIDNGKIRLKDALESISANLKKKSIHMSSHQCTIKLTSLKRQYKKIKDHNQKSGNDRQTWPYYERMDDIFRKKPWVNPIATLSSEEKENKEKEDAESQAPKLINSDTPKETTKRKSTSNPNQLEAIRDEMKLRREERRSQHKESMGKIDEMLQILRK